MIPGIAPVIPLRAGGGGITDGAIWDFATDRTAGWVADDSRGGGVISYDAQNASLRFQQVEAWGGILSAPIPVRVGASYDYAIDVRNNGPVGLLECEIRDLIGGSTIVTTVRVAVNARVTLIGTVVAPSPGLQIKITIRGGGSSSLSLYYAAILPQ